MKKYGHQLTLKQVIIQLMKRKVWGQPRYSVKNMATLFASFLSMIIVLNYVVAATLKTQQKLDCLKSSQNQVLVLARDELKQELVKVPMNTIKKSLEFLRK